MPHRLILKVAKFQLPPPKRLGTVVKNILGGHHAPPPMSNRVNSYMCFSLDQIIKDNEIKIDIYLFKYDYFHCQVVFKLILENEREIPRDKKLLKNPLCGMAGGNNKS